MAGNVRYAQTVLSGVGMGTEAIDYHVHTFHHGFCYEFAVGFAQTDGGGMEGSTCLIQWLTESNEQKLVDLLLSQVSFIDPQTKNKPAAQTAPMPAVTPFELSRSSDSQFAVSWSVAGADYVQLQYPCVEQVFVIGDAGSQMLCGVRPRRNFPAHGAATLLLMN